MYIEIETRNNLPYLAISLLIANLEIVLFFVSVFSVKLIIEKIFRKENSFLINMLIFLAVVYIVGYVNILLGVGVLLLEILLTIFIFLGFFLILHTITKTKKLNIFNIDQNEIRIYIIAILIVNIEYLIYHINNSGYILLHQSLPLHLTKVYEIVDGTTIHPTPSYTNFPFVLPAIGHIYSSMLLSKFTSCEFKYVILPIISFTFSSLILLLFQVVYVYKIILQIIKCDDNKHCRYFAFFISSLMPIFTLLYGGLNESFTFTPRGFLYVLFIATIFELVKRFNYIQNNDKKVLNLLLSYIILATIFSYVNLIFFVKFYNHVFSQLLYILILTLLFLLGKIKNTKFEQISRTDIFLFFIYPLVHTFEAPLYLTILLVTFLFNRILSDHFKSKKTIIIVSILVQLISTSIFLYPIYYHQPLLPIRFSSFIFSENIDVKYVNPLDLFYGMSLFSFSFYFPGFATYIILKRLKSFNNGIFILIYALYVMEILVLFFNGDIIVHTRLFGPISIISYLTTSILLLVPGKGNNLLYLIGFTILFGLIGRINPTYILPLINFKHPLGPETTLLFDFAEFYCIKLLKENLMINPSIISSDIYGVTQITTFFKLKTPLITTVMDDIRLDITEHAKLLPTIHFYNYIGYFSIIGQLNNSIILINSRAISQYNLPKINLRPLQDLNATLNRDIVYLDFYYYRGIRLVISRPISLYGIAIYVKNIDKDMQKIMIFIYKDMLTNDTLIYDISYNVPPYYTGYLVIRTNKSILLEPASYYVLVLFPQPVLSAYSLSPPYNYFEIINGSIRELPRKMLIHICDDPASCMYIDNNKNITPEAFLNIIVLFYVDSSCITYISKYNIIAYFCPKYT